MASDMISGYDLDSLRAAIVASMQPTSKA